MDSIELIQTNALIDSSSSIVTANGLQLMPHAPEKSLVFRTSGTSGDGKFIVLQKAGILSSARCVNTLLEINQTSVLGLILPWWHVGGMGVIARSFVAGCRMVHFADRWNPLACCEWIAREKITHLSLVPTQIHDLFTSYSEAPKSLRAVVVGGGNLPESVEVGARKLGWPLLRSFGMTEASSQIATQKLHNFNQSFDGGRLSILDCWQARINEGGLLEIAGEPLFSGTLYQQDDRWEYVPREGKWWTTSDRVALEARTLRWLGRADDLVKILGELVSLHRVEEELAVAGLVPGTFAVIAASDERKEHALHLFSESEAMDAIHRYHATCAGFARIDAIHRMSLPRTELGKIRRGELLKVLG